MESYDYSPSPNHTLYYNEYDENPEVFGYITLGVKCTIMVWIILINILFLAAMNSRDFRKKCSHWLLMNLAVADLLVGLLVVPFAIYLAVFNYWQLGKIACNIWILSDVLLCCVSLFGLLTINIDRLVFVSKPLTYTMVMRKAISVCLIVFSWLLAIGVMVPLVVTDQIRATQGHCYMSAAPAYAIGSALVSFYLPALLVIITNICIVVIVSKKTKTKRKPSIYLDKSYDDRPTLAAGGPVVMPTMVEARERASRDGYRQLKKAVVTMCVANCFYLIMWLPFFLLNALIALELYKGISSFAMEFCLWLGYANSGLNPLIWMLYPDVRKAMKRTVCCCCIRRSRYASVPDDTYIYTKSTLYSNTM